MGKIPHIAYRAVDVEGMANFFVNGLGMSITQRRRNRAIDLSDVGKGVKHEFLT